MSLKTALFKKLKGKSKIVIIGKVVGVHGIKGELKTRLIEELGEFNNLKKVLLNGRTFFVETYRFHKTNLLLKLTEVTDRNLAEALIGSEVAVEDIVLSPVVKQKKEIIGKKVFDTKNRPLGVLTEFVETAVHAVLVIKDLNLGTEKLVPFLEKFVKEIGNDKIIVDLTDLAEERADEI